MAVGEFTDRDEALDAVEELLAVDGRARLLVVSGVTGQGKTRLLARAAELHADRYRRVGIDLQTLVAGGFAGLDDQRIAAGVDDVAVLLLRELAAGLASQARWWRRRRVRRLADRVGTDIVPRRVDNRQCALFGGRIAESPQTVHVGVSPVDAVRRGVWVAQLVEVACRVRRRRVLLTVDTCEWMYVFDAVAPARPAGISSWFTVQVLPPLLAAAPRLRVILAGWDDLPVPDTVASVGPCQLTGWLRVHTRAFLTSAGITDPRLLNLLVDVVHPDDDTADERDSSGLPLLAAVLADTAPTSQAERDRLLSQPAPRWVPERILGRLSGRQRDEVAAAAVLREITLPTLTALLTDTTPADTDWFTRLTSRGFLQPLPAGPGRHQPRWRMHRLVRRWLLDHLADADRETPSGQQRLPDLHRRAAAYYTDLADRLPGAWQLEIAYHRFALGDPAPAAGWRRELFTFAHAGRLASLAAVTDVVLAPEQQARVRDRLPAVAADALACSAWVEYLRGRHDHAERQALDAAGLYQQLDQPAGQAWAWQLAGQAAWTTWRWTRATEHWHHALDVVRASGSPAQLFTVLTALAEATLDCVELPAARVLLDEARTLTATHPQQETAPPADPVVPPAVPLAGAVPADRLAARLALLAADTAIRGHDLAQAAVLLDHADQLATHPHDQVEVLRLRAELALADDRPPDAVRYADQAAAALTPTALTPTGDNPALRTMVLLTQAAAAERISTYGPPPGVRPPLLPGDRPTRALSLTDATESRNQLQLALRYAEAALSLATDIGNLHTRARALHTLGHHDQAHALYTQIGDRLGQANALYSLGQVAQVRGDYAGAEEQYSAAQALYTQIGNRPGQAHALLGLGQLALVRGDIAGAEEQCSAAQALYTQIGNRYGQADALRGLGQLAQGRGDIAGAEEQYSAAQALYTQIGNRYGQAHALLGLGQVALVRGDYAGAEEQYSAARTLYTQIGNRPGQADALRGLGDVALGRGNDDHARTHLAQAVDLYTALGLTELANDARRRIPTT
ncbi:tetratricopeptide repeat protein [Frankia sp. Cas3]|uniref:tetratricopeptide repeat protein n=1 Tax=Frankia sp. Cas3 TaxID=3073926 RepID=UPI002AD453F7|nr:tetratricopeptide repeat protein [Frankia sp. Cas3]